MSSGSGTRSGTRRLLLASFALAAMLAVIGREAVAHRWAHTEADAVDEIVSNALPGLRELGGMSGDLHALRLMAVELEVVPPSKRAIVEREVESVLSSMDNRVIRYRTLPTSRGEEELGAKLGAALDDVHRAARLLPGAVDEQGANEADQQVYTTTARAESILQTLSLLNVTGATDAAATITANNEVRRRITSILLVATLAVIILGAWFVERRLVRIEREAAVREKDERIADLDAFAARVAHDLKGPLAPALLGLQLLRRNERLDATSMKRIVDRIDHSLKHVVALIDGLLTFARMSATATKGGPSSIEAVVAEITPALRLLADEEHADLVVQVEHDLTVPASKAVLESILDNLARNALIYLGESKRREVRVRAHCEGAVACLEVSDTGPGIPSDALGRLFQPFERASTRPGTGLGLATVKRLVESLHGELRVNTCAGAGTTFTIRLPRRAS